MDALGAFLGVGGSVDQDCHPIIHDLFGPKGEGRDRILRNAEAALGITFDLDQIKTVREIRCPCVAFLDTAGAGKTERMLAMAQWLVERKNTATVFLTAPSLIMARGLYERFIKIVRHEKVLFLAVTSSEHSMQDRGTNYLEQIADQSVTPQLQSHNAAISACEKGQRWDGALGLLETVVGQSLTPDLVGVYMYLSIYL